MRQQQRTLKTEQYVKPENSKNKGFWLSLEVQENIQNIRDKNESMTACRHERVERDEQNANFAKNQNNSNNG